jgi:hypothetical protein
MSSSPGRRPELEQDAVDVNEELGDKCLFPYEDPKVS